MTAHITKLRYKNIRLSAYNEFPQEENSFHVDLRVAEDEQWTDKKILERVIKPGFNCLYSRMIPEMPDPMNNMDAFSQWNLEHYGR